MFSGGVVFVSRFVNTHQLIQYLLKVEGVFCAFRRKYVLVKSSFKPEVWSSRIRATAGGILSTMDTPALTGFNYGY